MWNDGSIVIGVRLIHPTTMILLMMASSILVVLTFFLLMCTATMAVPTPPTGYAAFYNRTELIAAVTDRVGRYACPPCDLLLSTGQDKFASAVYGPNIDDWDIRAVKDMTRVFEFAYFSGSLAKWDTSAVTDMTYMFANAVGDLSSWAISKWNMSAVTRMSCMFLENYFTLNSTAISPIGRPALSLI